MRRSLRQLAVLGVVALAAPVAAQDDAGDSPRRDAGRRTVTALLEAERTLLDEALEAYRSLVRQRPDLLARLSQLHEALDAEVAKGAGAAPERLEQLLSILAQAGADLDVRLEQEREALSRIREHLSRIALLDPLSALEGRSEPEAVGLLSGTWDIVLLPLDQKGSCVLHQTGAVLSGTYSLQGGYSGSLQGTLVNRKVFLVRIDSRLGKIMELEGFLAADAKMIRGTWLNYELAGAEGSTGHWSATRRPAGP